MSGYAPIIGPMQEGVSRYRDLPVLTRCTTCQDPLWPFETYSVASHGRVAAEGLCRTCAHGLASGDAGEGGGS